ncbi:MAG TPA: ABC transporter substrate-binding protein [Methanothrix sp.]|nr:ABC transporter substrate-binding protein [Methanothrix sp.]
MSGILRLMRLAGICAILSVMASVASFASDTFIPGDRDADHVVTDAEMALAEQDYKNGNISSSDLGQIKLIHDRYPVEVTDSAGNDIKIYRPLERVVVLNGLVTEMMQILNATDVIIGVTSDLKNEPLISPTLKSLSAVGKVTEPDLEAILQLDPDAVINYASTSWKSDEIQKKLHKANPNLIVVRLDMHHPETHVKEVETLAAILDRESEAREYINFYDGVMDRIKRAIEGLSDDRRPRVYFEERKDYQTGSNESYFSEDTALAGGRNVFADMPAVYPVVDQESIMAKNPDIIIRTSYNRSSGGYTNDDISDMQELQKSIIDRPGSEDISAVKAGRVYILNGYLIGGARHIIGLSYLAKIIHPDLLSDFDPVQVHQRYLDLLGFEFDLNKHNAFVLPKL